MTLVDTTDGILMVGAYGWAFIEAHPQTVLHSHHYLRVGNRGTAGGGIEAIGLLKDQLNMTGNGRKRARGLSRTPSSAGTISTYPRSWRRWMTPCVEKRS
jgi:high-affinity nickel permease